jgi:hypothetical protein
MIPGIEGLVRSLYIWNQDDIQNHAERSWKHNLAIISCSITMIFMSQIDKPMIEEDIQIVLHMQGD